MRIRRDLVLIDCAAFARSFGTGLLGVLLGIYLFRLGYSSVLIGIVVAAGLAGSAAATVVVTYASDRLGRRRTLLVLAGMAAFGGLALAWFTHPVALVLFAFLGMVNGMGTDRSASFALEQAIVPSLVSDVRRTWALSWYNFVLDSSGALGALAAGSAAVLHGRAGLSEVAAGRVLLLGYAILQVCSIVSYGLLTPSVEVGQCNSARVTLSPGSERVVRKLSALFAIDSFGGGFLTDALVAYWFFHRFGVSLEYLAVLFFAVHVLNAASHLGAAWLAGRIGLLNTMVFTHLPSNIFLIAVPFAPSFGAAAVLFLLRESLVEMDVPTRQSYVAAVVQPQERTYASGITNLTRNVSWAVSSSLSGFLMQSLFSAPLLLGGGLKIGYDFLLYRAFRRIHPPEEISTKSLTHMPRQPAGR
jgi:MFS family permease